MMDPSCAIKRNLDCALSSLPRTVPGGVLTSLPRTDPSCASGIDLIFDPKMNPSHETSCELKTDPSCAPRMDQLYA